MATYLSMVNAVIVKTVAFAADSEVKPCTIHVTSPNTYEYLQEKKKNPPRNYTICSTFEMFTIKLIILNS